MRHHVVLQPPFLLHGHAPVNVGLVGLHLLDHLVGDLLQAQLFFRFGQPNPQLSPGLNLNRQSSLHHGVYLCLFAEDFMKFTVLAVATGEGRLVAVHAVDG